MNFESTFGEQYPGLFRYCHSLTGDPDLADDLAQEAFVRLYDRRGGDGRRLAGVAFSYGHAPGPG